LNQIINNHNMPSSRISLLDSNYSVVSFPNFSTNNLQTNCVMQATRETIKVVQSECKTDASISIKEMK
jgi:hypothetical protein